jgi:hypothetical protein
MPEAGRLYLDEDAQRAALARALRARQIDVLTANEAGRIALSDEAQLRYAVSMDRTVFTFNRGHFVQLHIRFVEAGEFHGGIIVSDQLEIGVVIRRLLRLIDARTAEDMRSRLEFLSDWR